MKNKNLAKRVKELRRKRGFSQDKLTEDSGLSLRTIQRIENGEAEPRGDTIKRLANALNVTPDDLIDWTILKDKSYLKAINLSTLTFIVFPILGIILPLIMWTSKKDKIEGVSKLGKDIINFEITWSVSLFLGLILNYIFLIDKVEFSNEISPSLIIPSLKFSVIFIIFMYSYNLIIIVLNLYLVHKEKRNKYYPKISFVR